MQSHRGSPWLAATPGSHRGQDHQWELGDPRKQGLLQCRNDVIAYALNHMPPRYVVNVSGSVMVKLESWRQQGLTDVRAALTRAAMLVGEKPRH